MQIEERVVGDVTILDLKGKITLGEGDEALKDKINSLRDQGQKKILLNLRGVPYIDSAGLGEIVRTYTTVSRQGGQLKLVNLTKRITDLLSITKLLTVFETFDSEAEALKSYSRTPGPDPAPLALRWRVVSARSRSNSHARSAGRARWPPISSSHVRPGQWTKNLIVFAGLIFGEKLLDRTRLARRRSRCWSSARCRASSTSSTTSAIAKRSAAPAKRSGRLPRARCRCRSRLAAAAVLAACGCGAACWLGRDASLSSGGYLRAARALLGSAEAHRDHRRADDRHRVRAARGRPARSPSACRSASGC